MELISATNLANDILIECAKILDSYWGGGIENRRLGLISSSQHCFLLINSKNYEPYQTVAQQMAQEAGKCQDMIDSSAEDIVIGHVKLDPIYKQCDNLYGNSKCGVITSVIIHQKHRQSGSGYGKLLMELLEQYALKNEFHYLYLWTNDATPFYLKLGYQITERILEFTTVFRNLEVKAVSKLENMLTMKLQNHLSNPHPLHLEGEQSSQITPGGACASSSQLPYVYMKKRILDEYPLQLQTKSQWKDLLCETIYRNPAINSSSGHCLFLHRLRWAPQIGPSCGIQALRICLDYFQSHFPTPAPGPGAAGQDPSTLTLLRIAITAGYSNDGEMFNIFHLLELISRFYHLPPPSPSPAPSSGSSLSLSSLELSVTSFSSLSWDDITSIFSTSSKTGLIILPYDRSVNGSYPSQENGRSAHYGVICGYLEMSSNDESEIEEIETTNEELLSLKWGLGHGVERYLIMIQGMSLAPIIAPYSSFLASNRQLFQDMSHGEPLVSSNSYILPEGGPILADYCLIFRQI
jgi:N-acetylglutamate synthase-like GNAT family acetyltransferase